MGSNMSEITLETEKALRELELDTIYFTEFMNVNASKSYDYIVLIEGDDASYYMSLCATILNTPDIYYVRCNGKKNVLETLSTIENNKTKDYGKSKCFGIIDKDYGLDNEHKKYNLNQQRLYITPVYSYENFYITDIFFKNLLASHFHITEHGIFKGDYLRALDNYESRLREYIDIVKNIDKFYRATQISKKLLDEGLPSYNANNINIGNNVINISISEVKLKNEENIFKNNIAESYSEDSLSIAEREYTHSDLREYTRNIRGKFLSQFIINYVKELLKDVAKNNIENSKIFIERRDALRNQKVQNESDRLPRIKEIQVHKISLQVTDSNFFPLLASCAEQPSCLKTFLEVFKENYS